MNWAVSLHPGGPLEPHDLWTAWNVEPWLLFPLACAVFIYIWGMRNVWQQAGAGHGIRTRSWVSFLGAVVALVIALVSPLDALAGVLFSAHMTQHLLLVLVAAPLLVMSDFPVALLWALPRGSAQALGQTSNQSPAVSRLWRVISSPASAWLLFAITLWIWHTPALYEAALREEPVHELEHLIFLVTAMLFWWVLFKQTTQKHVHYGMAILYLFTTILHSGVLGALMTFTSQPWYPYYAGLVWSWGLTPLQDQQLAGLIMWIPGGILLTLLTIRYFALWFRALEERSQRLTYRRMIRTQED